MLPYVKDTDTILLANHGTITYGSDLEDAYFKTEIIDAYCRILILAKQLGRVNYYADEKAAELIKLKPKLGIPDPRLERGLENCDLCGNSLFREGYDETPARAPRLHPSQVRRQRAARVAHRGIPDADSLAVAAECRLGAARPQARQRSRRVTAMPRAGGADTEALVQTITDQVMQALNGAAR